MALTVEFETNPRLIVIRASGVLLRAESDAAKRQVHDWMEEHGAAPALIVVEEGFSNLEAFASWDDIDVDTYLQAHVVRLAIVGDLRWRDTAMLFLASAIAKFKMDYFPQAQESLARAWLLH